MIKKTLSILCIVSLILIIPTTLNSNQVNDVEENSSLFSLNGVTAIDPQWSQPKLITTEDITDFNIIQQSDGETELVFKRNTDNYWYNSRLVNNELFDINIQNLPYNSYNYFIKEFNGSVYGDFSNKLYKKVNTTSWEFFSYGINYSIQDLDVNSYGNFYILSHSDPHYIWFSNNGVDWSIANRSTIYDPTYTGNKKLLEKDGVFYVIFKEYYDFKIIKSSDGSNWGSINTIFTNLITDADIRDFGRFSNGTVYLLYKPIYLSGGYRPVFLVTSNDPDLLIWNEPMQLTPNNTMPFDSILIENPDKTLSLYYRANSIDIFLITNARDLSLDISSKPTYIDLNDQFYLDLTITDSNLINVPNTFISLDLYFPNNTYFTTITNLTDSFGYTSFSFYLTGLDPGTYSYYLIASKANLGSFTSKKYVFNYLIRDAEFPYIMFLNNISYSNVTQELMINLDIQSFDIDDFNGYLYFTLFNLNNVPMRTVYYAITVNKSVIENFNESLFQLHESGNYYGQIVLRTDTAENFGVPILFKEFNILV